MSSVILHVRPGQENERGPLYMESAVAALHSLDRADTPISLEIGMAEGLVGFYIVTTQNASPLVESQLYGQYPDADIDEVREDPFALRPHEGVLSLDLTLSAPEIFPIKRHPQFDDLLSRANMDPLSGMTSALARYPLPGMRGHVQIILRPLGGSFRRRALRFLPLLQRGLPSISPRYAAFFTRVQLSRGWRRIFLLPLSILLGGFRAWPILNKIPSMTAGGTVRSGFEDEGGDHLPSSARSHDREDPVAGARDKVNRLLFLGNVRVNVIHGSGQEREAIRKALEIAGTFQQFTLPQSNGFTVQRPSAAAGILRDARARAYVLSAEEIATLWHVPTILVQTPNLNRVLSKKLEPPVNLPVLDITDPKEDLTVLGQALFHGRRNLFGIRRDDRRRHIYIIGKTGMGKSVLLENMVVSDIRAGRGVGVIDPHGDLIESILQSIPKDRSNDVVLFDPADREHPISFNILECPEPDQRPLVASGLMSVFTKMWPDAFSGRMEHILRNTLLALLEYEGSSMLGILRMFGDDAYRAKVVAKVKDPVVRSFWEGEYAVWSEKYRTEAIAAIQNKIGQLLTTPLIRNIVGQVRSSLDLRHAMDTGKIILVNLSKGKLGEDTSAFLGSMLVTKFQIDAMSRADVPEEERRDFYLYVDEFQNFATESFGTILSEARKYRLSLTMANQYIGQLLIGERSSTSLRDAIFGNVGSLLSFQVGSDDAEALSLQFEEMAMPKDLLSLPKYHAYMRLMIDGIPSKPFSVVTLPPPQYKQHARRVEVIRHLSRERYAEGRSVVEDKISRWAASAAEAKAVAKQAEKTKEKEEEERKKARAKGMTLEAYRAWRDREMWTNEFNQLRKKKMLGEAMSVLETTKYADLEKRLSAGGGVPPPSKALIQAAINAGKDVREFMTAAPAESPAPVQMEERRVEKKPKR